jgi:hypothetical protein
MGSQYALFAFFGTTDSNGTSLGLNYDNSSTYTTLAAGVGFNTSCIKSRRSYDLLPVSDTSMTTGRIFSLGFSWDQARPNTIGLDLLRKSDSSCVGYYEVTNCTLEAATVEYPVQVQLNNSSPLPGPWYSLVANTNRTNDRVLGNLPVYPLEGQFDSDGVGNTTYGGIANLFGSFFNSTYDVSSLRGDYGNTSTTGQFVSSLIPRGAGQGYYCNITFNLGLEQIAFYQQLDGGEPPLILGILLLPPRTRQT